MLYAYNEVWCRLKKPLVSKGVTARVQDRMARLGSSREWEERSTTACSYFLHCARAGQKKVLWFQPGVGERSTTAHLLFFTASAQNRNMRFCCSLFFEGGFQPGVGERNTAACSHFFTARVQDGALFTGFVVRVQCPFDPFWPAMTKRCHEHLSARGCSS